MEDKERNPDIQENSNNQEIKKVIWMKIMRNR